MALISAATTISGRKRASDLSTAFDTIVSEWHTERDECNRNIAKLERRVQQLEGGRVQRRRTS